MSVEPVGNPRVLSSDLGPAASLLATKAARRKRRARTSTTRWIRARPSIRALPRKRTTRRGT